MEAALILADGTVYRGQGVGAAEDVAGEVVFNTGLTGYQEILTDPSYCGQIVVMTYPLIGNYGINTEDMESSRSHVRGLIAREFCALPNNWRAAQTITAFLAEQGITGLVGVDTRALTRHLRTCGTMPGRIVVGAAVREPEAEPARTDTHLVYRTVLPQIRHIPGPGFRVVVIDCGVKNNILRSLSIRGCEIVIVPPWTGAEAIMNWQPDGVLLSNGPGDPAELPEVAATVRNLLGRAPVFGICLGHQILGLACGARTYKLKFGHRGVNHPVKDLATGRVYITSQNHGYAVDGASLPADLRVTQSNVNDGTVEGLAHKFFPAFSVQYHPEASPGPTDAAFLFDRFMEMMARHREGSGDSCHKRAI